MSVASPSRAAFPVSRAGRHPRLHFRGLLRLHSNYGPLDRSTAQGGLCRRASIHPITRTNRLPATRSNRQLSGWFLPPLVIRAFWAHCEVSDLGGDGQGCRAQSMLPAPALDPGAARKPAHQHTRRCRRKPYRARRLRHHAERPALRPAPPRAAGMSPFIETPARRERRQAQAHQGKRLQQGSFIRRIGQRRGTQR